MKLNNLGEKKYHLLCAIDSLTGGGAEKVISNIVNRLDYKRFKIQLVMTLGNDIKQNIAPHVRIISLNANSPKGLKQRKTNPFKKMFGQFLFKALHANKTPQAGKYFSWLIRYQTLFNFLHSMYFHAAILGRHIGNTHPDCILSFLPLTNLLCLFARCRYRMKTPIIMSDRNYLSCEIKNLPHTKFLHRCIRFSYPYAEHHVAVSNASREDLEKNFGISGEKITTIYNGVDRDFLASQAKFSIKYPHAKDEVRLVAAGRLHYQKGFDLLLEALARTRWRNWRLWLLGSGPEEAALRQQAKSLGLNEFVDFLGYDHNPWRWFSRADFFVLSSRWEGFPNVMIEAMILGLPVIAFDCPSGPAEILENGRWGCLVPSESPIALAAAIDEFIINFEKRAKLASLAQLRAADFDISLMVDAYENLLLKRIYQTKMERNA